MATVYVQLFQSPYLYTSHKLDPTNVCIIVMCYCGTDSPITQFPAGVVTVPESWQNCAGPASLWDMHVEELGEDQITFLSEPHTATEYAICTVTFRTSISNTLIMQSILHTRTRKLCRFTFMRPPVTSPQQCEVHVTHSGLCHGLIMWWELSFCPNVSLSTSPWKRTQVN